MPATWSRADVLWELLRAGRGWNDRRAVLDFYARRALSRGRGEDPTYDIALHELAGPLRVEAGTGGLGTYYEIVVQRVYQANSKWVPPVGGRVVDVGANVGVFSLWAAEAVGPGGSVQAFEPNPSATRVLRQSVRTVPQIQVFEVACGDVPGTATLNFTPGRLSTGSLLPRADKLHTVDVEVVRLDDVLGDDPIDLLKIDVEGVELEVLRGAPGRCSALTGSRSRSTAAISARACGSPRRPA